ncbi:DDE-type integrase/transposase/recombinase [Bacillus pseudomycoides]|nr:DDE-type integrase/transposase/recombinase [Bacillus pseudomycoides]KFN10650.1 DDE domain protein [Bacillus pseudomycoides]MED0857901.1 DDE-type integrase/transposase/recombinase [Bacillus pseudomycoides]
MELQEVAPTFREFRTLKDNRLFYKQFISISKPQKKLHERSQLFYKNLNNLIEQDHRHVKRRFAKSAGFQNLRHASRTIKGIETIHALYKQRRSLQRDSAFSTYNELQQLLATS